MEADLNTVKAHLSSLELPCWIANITTKEPKYGLNLDFGRGWGPAKPELSAQASRALQECGQEKERRFIPGECSLKYILQNLNE